MYRELLNVSCKLVPVTTKVRTQRSVGHPCFRCRTNIQKLIFHSFLLSLSLSLRVSFFVSFKDSCLVSTYIPTSRISRPASSYFCTLGFYGYRHFTLPDVHYFLWKQLPSWCFLWQWLRHTRINVSFSVAFRCTLFSILFFLFVFAWPESSCFFRHRCNYTSDDYLATGFFSFCFSLGYRL